MTDQAAEGTSTDKTVAEPDLNKSTEKVDESLNESKPSTEEVEVAKKEKPKKDKLMKKFSFRAFSFGKKDKQKPQTTKDAEAVAATVSLIIFL